MTKKTNLEEIEKTIDFESVTKKLDHLSTFGGLKRRTKISDLLDKVKPALLRARENKVSLQSLTEFLNSSGIPVSEPTLRHYLNSEKGVKKRRKVKPSSGLRPSASLAAEMTVVPAPAPETPTRKLPPRLARREQQ